MKAYEVKQRLQKIDNLPTLPTIASKILDLASNPSSSMKQISDIINRDPSLTSKVLKIANSAYYGLRKEITTVRMALVVLGINEIKDIVFSISIFNSFSRESGDSGFDLEMFWTHSMIVAHIAKFLNKEYNLNLKGIEYTAGIIHDIGKIIMEQHFSEEMSEIIEIKNEDSSREIFEIESDILGVTHMDIGAWLVKKWKLPKDLIDSIRYHHYPKIPESNVLLVGLINLSDSIANKLQYGQFSMSDELFYNLETWNIINENFQEDENFNIDKILEEIEKSIENSTSVVKNL